jgi:hypothetical protein
VIDDRRDLAVGIDLDEVGRELLAFPHVDELGVVGKLELLQCEENLLHIRTGQRIEIDHGRLFRQWWGRQD